jgi:hypothetical protein
MGWGAAISAIAGVYAATQRPKVPSIPSIPAPAPMPVPGPDDPSTINARRNSIQAQLLRRGRLSSILSQGAQSEPLGGLGP